MSANDQEGVRGDGRTSYEEAGRGSRKSYGESGRGGRKSYEEAGRGGRKEYDAEGRGSRNGGWRQKRKKADLTKEVNKDDMKVRESVLAVTTVITEVKVHLKNVFPVVFSFQVLVLNLKYCQWGSKLLLLNFEC
ncbi:eukaryotic translation initiation factor 3 subunit D-like [Eurytemora carolleeae]|uniref:eukaryotic translation initiation factor 3 subunit D-like n=1 Tax=Eurytemora carolleeae TaxID=1294199 RepID=UPI000C776E81|nr:eukaryotic translation initiation factor 3 subunit D-like [Eurytemora carolleeae]|eukprot:XP_023330480.1 eukaryotic translation initiation factor 3 subunit D-like [Eurytemora affinis]